MCEPKPVMLGIWTEILTLEIRPHTPDNSIYQE
jgi:hypothetical protein